MAEWQPIETHMVTRAELREWLVCDECGLQVQVVPWPEGWVGCGMSRRRVYRDCKQAGIPAYWCPQHSDGFTRHTNPKEKELQVIRDRLLEAERQPPTTQRWSARREGLIPLIHRSKANG